MRRSTKPIGQMTYGEAQTELQGEMLADIGSFWPERVDALRDRVAELRNPLPEVTAGTKFQDEYGNACKVEAVEGNFARVRKSLGKRRIVRQLMKIEDIKARLEKKAVGA